MDADGSRGATPAELESEGHVGVQGLAIYVMDPDGSHVRLVFDDGAMQDSPTGWRTSTMDIAS